MDTPRILRENLTVNAQELDKRHLEWRYSTREATIEDAYLDRLPETLTKITNHSERALSLALWHLLIEALPSEERQRDTFFRGIYHWFYYNKQSESFDSTFYRQLKDTAWLPDEQSNFHLPLNCFVLTDDNRRILGNSVAYLHSSFNVNESNEPARWLAGKLGVHLNANTESVLNHLQILSGKEVSIEDVKPLYRFLARQDARPREKFKKEYLLFAPNSVLCWWRADQVFWEDESPVFDNDRGYLRTYYSETLKPFFIALGVSERAAPLDYVRGIQEIASAGQAESSEVRKRVNILYRRLWQSLQEGGDWQATEEWNRTREGRYWLGKMGNRWGFFSRCELVWNDYHDYIAEIFEGEIPFWAFGDDLLGLAGNLEIEECSQAKVEFHPRGDQEEDEVWSVKVQGLHPYIHDFLNSPRLCEAHEEGKSARDLDGLSVCLVEELETMYTLKGISLSHPNPRESFLDVTNQKVTLWLALKSNADQYAWLIGDALQYYFGDVKELSGFIEDLLTKNQEAVLTRWRQKGLQEEVGKRQETEMDKTNDSAADESKTPTDSPSNIENINLPDTQTSTNTGSVNTQFTDEESEHETPMVNERPEISSGGVNSESEKSETGVPSARTNGTSQSTGPPKSIYNSVSGVDSHGGRDDTDGEIQSEETETSSHARKEIEHIGMEHARRYEEKQGRIVEDVSAENLGFDLRSASPDNKIRCIEVKARADRAFVILTSNEWSVAEQLKDNYFLYVVLNAVTQPELYIIQNPADAINAVEQVDVRYQVPLSEITEHGKLV